LFTKIQIKTNSLLFLDFIYGIVIFIRLFGVKDQYFNYLGYLIHLISFLLSFDYKFKNFLYFLILLKILISLIQIYLLLLSKQTPLTKPFHLLIFLIMFLSIYDATTNVDINSFLVIHFLFL